MANIPPKDISSPKELETPGFITIRGRILGSQRLGKKAGIAAIAVLVLLVSAILYGVTLNGGHVGAPNQQLPRPLPAVNDIPWWQNQSNASGVTKPRPDNTLFEARSLPTGVPDLNQVGDTSNSTSKFSGTSPQAKMPDQPVQITKFPTLPPIDENSVDTLTDSGNQQRANQVVPNQRESNRRAAMMSPSLLGGQPERTGGLALDVARSVPNSLGTATAATSSQFKLKAGSIIPATLVTAIDSDLPGLVVAQIRQSVFDTVAGRFLLIPQGARLVGTYDSRIAYGQDRLLVTWTRIIYPDGSSSDLQSMAGTDLSGRSGFDAQVDNHTRKLFQGALLLSIIGAGAQLSQPQQSVTNGSVPTVGQVVVGSVAGQLASAGTQMTQRQLNVPPNLRVAPGYQFNVVVDHDLTFSGPYVGP
jgi:type IV secretory pathway VirB10-like protein